MVTRDDEGRTPLILAAATKNKTAVEEVVVMLENHPWADNVSATRAHTCLQGSRHCIKNHKLWARSKTSLHTPCVVRSQR